MITHSRANLELTLTKLVLRTKDLIFMLLDGLEVFLDVCVMSWDSSNLQMAGEHIYIGHTLELAVGPPSSADVIAPMLAPMGHRFFRW